MILPRHSRDLRTVNQKPPPGSSLDPYRLGYKMEVCYLNNEGAGGSVWDAGQRVRSSQFVGSPAWVGGASGRCLRFVAASSQYVPLSTGRLLAKDNAAFTYAVRFRSINPGTSGLAMCAEASSSSSTPLFEIDMNNGAAGNLRAVLRSDNTTILTPNANSGVNDGKWHIAVAVNGGNGGTFALYLDGALVTSVTNTGLNTITLNTSTMGARVANTTTALFDGDIDFVQAWSRALTPFEVAQHYGMSFSMVQGAPAPQGGTVNVAGASFLTRGKRFGHYYLIPAAGASPSLSRVRKRMGKYFLVPI